MSTLDLLTAAYERIEAGRPNEALRILGPSPRDWSFTGTEHDIEAALFELYRGMAHRQMRAGDAALSAIRRAVQVFHSALSNPEIDPSRAPGAVIGIYYEAAVIEYLWGDRVATLRWGDEMYQLYNRPEFQNVRTTDTRYPVFLNDTGALALDLGQPGLARTFFSEASAVFSHRNDVAGVYKSLLNFATTEERLGNRETACRILRRVQSLGFNPTDDTQLGYLLARMSLDDGNLRQCEELINSLQTKHRESGSIDADFGVCLASSKAGLLRLQHRPDEAVQVLRDNLERISRLPRSDVGQIALQLQLASYLGEQGRLEEAIKVVEAARMICGERGYRELSARASSLLGGLQLLMGRGPEAYDLISQATRTYGMADSTLHLGFGEVVREGNIFTDHLLLLPSSAVAAGRPKEAVAHMLRLREDITRQFRRVKSAMRGDERSSVVQEYDSLHRVIDALGSLIAEDESFRNESSHYHAILENGLAARFDEMSRIDLEKRTNVEGDSSVLVECPPEHTAQLFLFPSGPDLIAIWVSNEGTVVPHFGNRVSEMEGLVRDLVHDVRDIGHRGAQILYRLSELLWRPIEDCVGDAKSEVQRLLVVPFGWCHYVPLHLLTCNDGSSLFERFEIACSSISSGRNLLGDRVESRSIQRVLFVSPFPVDLPGARDELSSLGSSGLSVDVLGVGDCTRSNLFTRLKENRYDVVHFACHALANYARPALSYLELAGNERCYLADLLRDCDCNGTGIVLGACDSMVASASRTDLKNSLADAFCFSGATAVVGSLWPLEDSATSTFMARLYGTAAEGHSFPSAFSRTFREFGRTMKKEGLSFRYWGSLTLSLAANTGTGAATPSRTRED